MEGIGISPFLELLRLGCLGDEELLRPKFYNHFVVLFCAVRLCSAQLYHTDECLNAAHELFLQFIAGYKSLYGSRYINSNMHNLAHIVGDVRRFGTLDKISAYRFENALYHIKRTIRGPKLPLAQLAKRSIESMAKVSRPAAAIVNHIKHHKDKCTIQLECYILSTEFEDMWFAFENNIFKMVNAHNDGTSFFISGAKLLQIDNLFKEPCESSMFLIYSSNNTLKCSTEIYKIDIFKIQCKFFVIKTFNERHAHVFIPIMHTLSKGDEFR